MDKVKIRTLENDEDGISSEILNNLKSYNISKIGIANRQGITISLHDSQDHLIGGMVGYSHWEWLFINLLWVNESFRGQKLGTKLIREIEKIAKDRKCIGIHLDTFDFQAPQFYEKLGYKLFGEIDNCPVIGKKRYFFKKDLI